MQTYYKNLGKICPTSEGDWDKTKEYTKLSFVFNQADNSTYLSKQDVPAETEITNVDYWQKIVDGSKIGSGNTPENGDGNIDNDNEEADGNNTFNLTAGTGLVINGTEIRLKIYSEGADGIIRQNGMIEPTQIPLGLGLCTVNGDLSISSDIDNTIPCNSAGHRSVAITNTSSNAGLIVDGAIFGTYNDGNVHMLTLSDDWLRRIFAERTDKNIHITDTEAGGLAINAPFGISNNRLTLKLGTGLNIDANNCLDIDCDNDHSFIGSLSSGNYNVIRLKIATDDKQGGVRCDETYFSAKGSDGCMLSLSDGFINKLKAAGVNL